MKMIELFEYVIAYHGTTNDFDEYDPRLTGDIGIHFGTKKQANDAIMSRWSKPLYSDGSNIRPVKLDISNSLRVKDTFSIIGKTWVGQAKQWTLLTPGFRVTNDERNVLYDLAKKLDYLRKKSGGDYSMILNKKNTDIHTLTKQLSKEFWQLIEQSAIRQGYDSFVYLNKAEGNGKEDSYVVFDPKKIQAYFGK